MKKRPIPLQEFLVFVRDGPPVGPHDITSLRVWVKRGVLSAECKACTTLGDQCVSLSEIPGFFDVPDLVLDQLAERQKKASLSWASDPPTKKQLRKLEYFEIPYVAQGLTKGRASELIEAFMEIDPDREDEYQKRPATPTQVAAIVALNGSPDGLTYDAAKGVIEDLKFERVEQQEEEAISLDILDYTLNDDDTREICAYKKLTKAQIRRMWEYLNVKMPDWQNRRKFEVGNLVTVVFPEQAKASHGRKSSSSRRKQSASGCLVLFAFQVFVAAGSALLAQLLG